MTAGTALADGSYGAGKAEAYSFTQPVEIERCNIDGQSLGQQALAPSGAAFYVVKDTSDKAVIQFLWWKEGTDNYTAFNVETSGTNEKLKLWCIEKATAGSRTQPHYLRTPRWSPMIGVGILVVPIKLRLGTGDARTTSFTTDAALGTALDLSWLISHTSDTSLHIPIFVAIGAADIKRSQSAVAEDRAVPTLSLGLGLGFSGARGGAGLLVGWDIINDSDTIKWDYQGRAWIGFSIGATFGVTSAQADARATQPKPP